jgi:hypothetical protein
MNGKCEMCRFFKSGPNPKPNDPAPHLIYGECWRFPTHIQSRPGGTCGEYHERPLE